ncbi:MAG: 50S ribosomal protein L17 [Anaerolineae bacterium]
MRHRVAGKKLSRSKDHRRALRRNLMNELFRHERIKTTRAKAEAIRGEAEKLITLAKRGLAADDAARGVHARRVALSRLNNRDSVQKLFDVLAPRYADRPGGYTRMYKLGPRVGDAAEMVLLELVDRETEE